MIFNSLMLRSPIETAEFISYMGTTEEAKAYAELNARTVIESLLEGVPIISRQRDVEIRKYRDCLALFSEKRFVLWRKVDGDHRKQAEDMISEFLALKRRRIPEGEGNL